MEPPTTASLASATPLTGKTALITGGSKGIGRAAAHVLSILGANIVINYSSDSAAADAVVDELGGASKAVAFQGDAASIAANEELVKKTVEKYGKIDILVLNAGVLDMKDLENTTEGSFDRSFAVNVKGPYFLAQVWSHVCSLIVSSPILSSMAKIHPRKQHLTCPHPPA